MASHSATAHLAPSSSDLDARFRALFLVTVPAEPQMLARVIEPAAKLGQVLDRVHATREAGDGSEMTIDLRLSGLSHRTAELLEYGLRAIYGVRQVLSVIERDGQSA